MNTGSILPITIERRKSAWLSVRFVMLLQRMHVR